MKGLFKGFACGLSAGAVLLALLLVCAFCSGRLEGNHQAAKKAELPMRQLEAEAVQTEPGDGTGEEETEGAEPLPEADSSKEEGAPPEEEELIEEETEEEVTVSFAGDVLFSERYLAAYDQSGIPAIADAEMLSQMQDCSLFLLNEEFPFSLRGEPMEDKQYTFRTDPKYVQIFKDLGVDIVTVANNHSLDFGQDAFLDTLETLEAAGIGCVGGGHSIEEASSPAVRELGGQTFAFFGATRVSPSYSWYATDSQPGLFQTYDPARLDEKISEASQDFDHVIVFVHWGIEYADTPEDYQRGLAQGYIDAGADLVVGSHPHVLQGFEFYDGTPIVYSLGNYLFSNQEKQTLLLKAVFPSAKEKPRLQLVPCRRADGVLARIQEAGALYQHLQEISYGAKITEEGEVIECGP